jgi:hypothetical protein
MTEEEVKQAHYDLKKALTTALWDFSDQHFSNKENVPQAINIMLSAVSESLSEIEYQIAQMLPFTRKQIDHICYQIGDWYFMMKPLLEVQHNLGHMKEKLKIMICGDE